MASRFVFAGARSVVVFIAIFGTTSPRAVSAPRTWIGGNADWVDAGSTANWSPADEPDADDEAVFNTANAVNLGSNNAINGLTMSGGIDLLVNDFDLTVDGLVQLAGASTNLLIGDAAGSVNADNVTINSGGTVELRGGALTLDEEVGTSLLDVNAGGTLAGNGVITFADAPLLATTLLVNDGTLTALSRASIVLLPPPAGTLQINDSSLGGRVDLDGTSGAGVVNVNRNQTLDLNVPISDAFSGTMNLFQNSTFDSSGAWTLDLGTITVDNGATGGLGGAPADTAFIKGGTLTQTGGVISVADTDGTLQLDANFTMSGGSFTNSGTAIFNGTTSITTAAGYVPTNLTAHTIVNGTMTITDAAGNFNWDGNGTAPTTINGTGSLSLNVNQVDTTDNIFGGTINLNDGGDLAVNNTINSWQAAGTINKNGAGTSSVGGDEIAVTGTLNVNAGTLDVNANAIFGSSSHVVIASGAIADMATTKIFNGANVTVNGTLSLGVNSLLEAPATLTGTGLFRFNSTSTVSANAVVNTTSFDWDGIGSGTLHTINDGVTFTINSTIWDADDAGDVDDPINLGGSGAAIIVNNVPSWTMTRTLTANTAGVGTATLGGDARLIFSGALSILSVNGNTAADSPLTFGASSNANIAAARTLRLNGGNLLATVNQLEGGAINGPGTLAANAGRTLRGFGTIGATVDFDGTASLLAENGTLTVNGAVTDVGTLGTFGATGTLDMTSAWNTNVANFVSLNGGELKGGTITNDGAAGISGNGLVSSRVVNNKNLTANGGAALIFQTAANDNDWDGAGNNGALSAQGAGAVLELRDNATFGFTGTVSATTGGRVFSNGFALDFNPGSTLQLQDSTYESTSSTDIGGTVSTVIGATQQSTIKVAVNHFLTFQSASTTTLGQNLRLENNNINIDAGAAFGGAGALVIPAASHLVADNLANIGVLLDMQGTFRPGGFDSIGRIDLLDYQQESTGQLFVELTGTALNAFDRLVLSGDAVLDGYLNIDIDGGFVPALGNTFNIITGNTVSGMFNLIDISGMPAGLTFHVNYLPNAVQLQVVSTPFFSADFDHDGDVDATDLAIWSGAYQLNQLGDADGDNDSDGGDFLLWQRQFGSHPAVAVTTSVPEPQAWLLALAGFAAATVGGIRRRPGARRRAGC
ncbi:MAG: hypothetical protein KDA44_10165 [Planctomycetales bacterium]|nr:hypothetical protein [Planctomycetales bacterium]